MNFELVTLIALVAVSLFVGRNMDNTWYIKSPLQPPGFVFPIIWSFLYVSLIVIYWITRDKLVFNLLVLSFILQILWLLTFNPQSYQASKWILLSIAVVALLLLLQVRSLNNTAFVLSSFYLLWTMFALYLNTTISTVK
jgi:benzodiazapine receptor